jgi:hypothetical protein
VLPYNDALIFEKAEGEKDKKIKMMISASHDGLEWLQYMPRLALKGRKESTSTCIRLANTSLKAPNEHS